MHRTSCTPANCTPKRSHSLQRWQSLSMKRKYRFDFKLRGMSCPFFKKNSGPYYDFDQESKTKSLKLTLMTLLSILSFVHTHFSVTLCTKRRPLLRKPQPFYVVGGDNSCWRIARGFISKSQQLTDWNHLPKRSSMYRLKYLSPFLTMKENSSRARFEFHFTAHSISAPETSTLERLQSNNNGGTPFSCLSFQGPRVLCPSLSFCHGSLGRYTVNLKSDFKHQCFYFSKSLL